MTSTDQLASQHPTPFDLQFTQGDSVYFTFYVKGVNWVEENPNEVGQPTWVESTWQSQIRNPYIFMVSQADMWVPVNSFQYTWWRQNSGVATFGTATELVEIEADATAADQLWILDPELQTTKLYKIGDEIPVGWYTELRIYLPSDMSARVFPGAWYRWDLQRTYMDGLVEKKRTYLRGRIRVLNQQTLL